MATEKTPPNELPVIPSMPEALPCPRCGQARPRVERRQDGSVRVRCADHACTYQLVVYPKDIEPLLEAVQRMLVIKMWNHRW